jgi:hypothetical protein
VAWPTVKKLTERILGIVQDRSFAAEDVLVYLNECLLEIAGREEPQILLPYLEAQADVATSTSGPSCDLPENFQKNLFGCYSLTQNRAIKVFNSKILLLQQFRPIDQVGLVRGVAQVGNKLWYQRIPPAAETLTLYFYELPTPLEDENSQPDCLPPHLARRLLENGVLAKIYDLIEDGIGDPKTNTTHYLELYNAALMDLAAFIGPEAHLPVEIEDDLHLDSLMEF